MTFVASIAKQKFLASDDAAWAKDQLEQMVEDGRYNTPEMPFYIHAQAESISFVDQHLMYLSENPQLKVQEYMSNLRLKTKIWGGAN